MERKRIEALWDCKYCESKGIFGRFGTCPNCGKKRDANNQFYMPSPEQIAQMEANAERQAQVTDRADWLCDYCGCYNASNLTRCPQCGASKEESKSDYGTINCQTDFSNWGG